MDELGQMLFSVQKLQILSLFSNASLEKGFSESYIYAWSEGVYPLLNHTAGWHQPFEACFPVRERQMAELFGFIERSCAQKQYPSFFELEDNYGIKGSRRPGEVWNQADLVRACRYFHLHEEFSPSFWAALLRDKECPSEAEVISRKFVSDDIAFE